MIGCNSQKEIKSVDEKIFLLKDSTVALVQYVDELDVFKSYCSGVWINEDEFLTAYHCVAVEGVDENKLNKQVEFVTYSEIKNSLDVEKVKYRAKVIATDESSDLALLRYGGKDKLEHSVASLNKNDIYDGDFVEAVGHTVGAMYTYCAGWVSSSNRDYKGPLTEKVKLIQVSMSIGPGNSGGGVYLDKKLIGIVSFGNRRIFSIAFIIHRDVIREFLELNNIDFKQE
jgi:S1-C subfamily serine protease